MPVPWSIRLVRALFLTICVLLGAMISVGFGGEAWVGTLGGLAMGLFFILVDALLAQFSFREFSNGTLGLMVGLFCAWLLSKIGIFDLPWFQELDDAAGVRKVVDISTYIVMGFLGITMALRSDRDQFSFIIPYVRFRRDASEGEPVLLDSNVLIDGRVPAVIATGFLSGSFVVPKSVLDELQQMADSKDEIRSARGKRGLDGVRKLQESGNPNISVSIHDDSHMDGVTVDLRLVNLATELRARLLTNDVNLGKSAQVQGITVLNFNDLAKALEPEIQVGDHFDLNLIKPGKDKHQAVGYLPNGAMIVVNHGAPFIGETVRVMVSGMHQTSAGRLIFAELDREGSIAEKAL